MATALQMKQLLPALRTEINAALAQIAQKHGLESLVAGNATFDPSAGFFKFALTGQMAGEIGRDGALYEQVRAFTPGLPPLGFEFVSPSNSSQRHKVVGANTTGSKVKTLSGGKPFLWPVDSVVRIAARAGHVHA